MSSATNSKSKSATNIYKDKNFYIISLVTLMSIMGGTIFNPTLPAIGKSFNVSSENVAQVSTLYQLPGAIITPIFGILTDSFGRKQMLIPSLLVFALGGALSGFASNFRSLLGWRLFQGIGNANLETLQLTIIGDLYKGKTLNSAMAFNAILIANSSALFPFIGGIIGGFSWRYPFLLSLLAIPVALSVLTTLKLPKQQTSTEKFQLKPYLQSTWNSINNRQVLGLLFAVMSLFMLQVTCLTYIPFLAGNSLGASGPLIGIILAAISVSLGLVASQLGFLVQKFTEIKLIKISFILTALALFIIPTIPNVWLLFIPIALLGAAQGIAFPSSLALLAGLAAQESRAGFMAVNSTTQSWGQTLGPLLGSIVDARWGTHAVFYASGIFSLISFVVFNALLTTKKGRISSPTQMPTQMPTQLPTVPASSPTILQHPIAKLIHLQNNRVIEFPENFSVINIGKPNDRIPPDVDVSEFPNSGVVSRIHAQIRFDGNDYYIQDMGSSNGTYINKYPVLPGIWYKLKPGLGIGLGRRDLVTFMFEVS